MTTEHIISDKSSVSVTVKGNQFTLNDIDNDDIRYKEQIRTMDKIIIKDKYYEIYSPQSILCVTAFGSICDEYFAKNKFNKCQFTIKTGLTLNGVVDETVQREGKGYINQVYPSIHGRHTYRILFEDEPKTVIRKIKE